jgi:hypothetical protein
MDTSLGNSRSFKVIKVNLKVNQGQGPGPTEGAALVANPRRAPIRASAASRIKSAHSTHRLHCQKRQCSLVFGISQNGRRWEESTRGLGEYSSASRRGLLSSRYERRLATGRSMCHPGTSEGIGNLVSTRDRTVDDRSLGARASRGDVEAFTKLVKANSSLVYRVSLRMLGNEDA